MSYRNLASVELPQETTIELTMEEKNKYISSVLNHARELAEREKFWREIREEAQKLVSAEEQRENERANEEENKRRKEERELAEREEFWKDIKRKSTESGISRGAKRK